MRLRVTQRLTGSIDGIPLDDLEQGRVYEVGTTLACYLLAEGWAEPAPDEIGAARPADKSRRRVDKRARDGHDGS